jgi:alkylation response protein AidB-like acyl-CoA dehydrogenase
MNQGKHQGGLLDQSLERLCAHLAELAPSLDATGAWPKRQLELCGESGVFRWFVGEEWGGANWPQRRILDGYLKISAGCLTTAFIITQRMGACLRIVESENESLRRELLPDLVAGRTFATVGISHLTTSRRHLGRPALAARQTAGGFVLDGFTPWVTGALHADHVVVGAELDDGRQILAAAPMDLKGVARAPAARLMALTASHTGEVHFQNALLDERWLIAGPVENVMQRGGGAGTGGLTTSALALGLSDAAITYLEEAQQKRAALAPATERLRDDWRGLVANLLSLADGDGGAASGPACSAQEMRSLANGMALRATQAALIAAKGAGYVSGNDVGRWCREALFFLVWSCPAPVQEAHLCELAGLENGSL